MIYPQIETIERRIESVRRVRTLLYNTPISVHEMTIDRDMLRDMSLYIYTLEKELIRVSDIYSQERTLRQYPIYQKDRDQDGSQSCYAESSEISEG